MKSKTQIDKQLVKKTNPELVQTILEAKKNKNWLEVAGLLSSPKANMTIINVDELNQKTKDGETILISGKVLSQGELNKKIKVIALNFSDKAKEKLLSSKCQVAYIQDEIKINPSGKGVKILK
jgi:large subunit ribosomal protein L18e